ncbi:MAG: TldD/PmbA family protein [Planctomycetota bacterium]
MFELLEKVLKEAKSWTEIRYHHRLRNTISVRKGELENISSNIYSGVGIRVLLNGAWGFSSTSKLTLKDLLYTLQESEKSAQILGSYKKDKIKPIPKTNLAQGKFAPQIGDDLHNHTLEEKLTLVLDTEKMVRKSSPLIQSASCAYSELLDEKYILTSDGARTHIIDMKPEFKVSAIAAKNGELTGAGESTGVTGGWDALFRNKKPKEMADKSAQTAIDLLQAEYPPGGKATVILDPAVVGLLVHEAIGHTVEADFVQAGAITKDKIGEQVASELVTLCDSGYSEIEPDAAGTVLVDDEGVSAKKVVIIEHGILRSYLHNRETAALFNVEPTGNARAFEYSNEPIIRMRNTYIEPGQSEFEEMVAGIKHGYFLKGAVGGQADSNAEFMFGIQQAYEITNGKIGKLLRGITISGQAFDVLKSVDAVGNRFKWDMGTGYCSKGQLAKVDGGGPYLRCQVIIGGRQK